jgi:hypothetical protein
MLNSQLTKETITKELDWIDSVVTRVENNKDSYNDPDISLSNFRDTFLEGREWLIEQLHSMENNFTNESDHNFPKRH